MSLFEEPAQSVFSEKKMRNYIASADRYFTMYADETELASMGVACMTFLYASIFVATHYQVLDYSSMLTLGGGMQSLGFALLHLLVRNRKSVAGVSGKSLQLYLLSILFRLSSTLTSHGYIPTDKTGDWLIQLADISTLLIVLQLLRRVYRTNAETYNETQDSMPIVPFIPFALVFSLLTYGDMNGKPFFDFMWMVGSTLDTVAMLPQLFLMTSIGGKVEGLASHYVACMHVSRACTFSFWYFAYPDVEPLGGGFNHCGYAIVVLHLAQLLTSGDFMFYYLKSAKEGKELILPMFSV